VHRSLGLWLAPASSSSSTRRTLPLDSPLRSHLCTTGASVCPVHFLSFFTINSRQSRARARELWPPACMSSCRAAGSPSITPCAFVCSIITLQLRISVLTNSRSTASRTIAFYLDSMPHSS
ncbi:hypothetical protein CPAR01_09564, partial [Colletotrichum paranaense]